mmetsp:Transcript_1689/g.2222  ORF Transcript_1689/g.2222 Transcript_1689/m.2222 type:complete len:286 (-) Transcript_1689:2515-3372(-)
MYLRSSSDLSNDAKVHKQRGTILKRVASGHYDDGSNTQFISHEDHATRNGKSLYWEQLWKHGVIRGKGFDNGKACVALEAYLNETDLLESGTLGGKKALIPGCGRGYDCVLLASKGFQVVGVEIAKSATEIAKNWIAQQSDQQNEQITIIHKNFFEVSDSYDLIFDCTFLCALHPHAREKWANKINSLLKPGGILICLVFPLVQGPTSFLANLFHRAVIGGPPYALTCELICDLLPQFSIMHKQDPLPHQLSHLPENPASAHSAFLVLQKPLSSSVGVGTASSPP